MTEAEVFYKNAVLGAEFDKYVVEHPQLAEKIPDNALVVILPADDPELCTLNLQMAKKHRMEHQPVVYVRIQKVRPPQKSRLVRPRLEVALN